MNMHWRDTVLIPAATLATLAAFLFAVYLPGRRAEADIDRQIAAAAASIGEVPLRLAELESLQQEIDSSRSYLRRTEQAAPADGNLHRVVAQVADLADSSGLADVKWEPLPPISHGIYEERAYRITFSGRFHGVARFLQGLERCSRLFVIERLSLSAQSASGQSAKPARLLRGEIKFAVYVRRDGFADSSDNRTSSPPENVDNEKKRSSFESL